MIKRLEKVFSPSITLRRKRGRTAWRCDRVTDFKLMAQITKGIGTAGAASSLRVEEADIDAFIRCASKLGYSVELIDENEEE